MSNEDKIYKVTQAKILPSWIEWGGYAAAFGLGWGYMLAPSTWIVYALVGFSIGLVYLGFECYNQFARYYNDQQIKDLALSPDFSHLFEQKDGTFQDKDGLIPCEEEEDEEDK